MKDELVQAVSRADWDSAKALLYKHWSTECPKVFAPTSDHPWETSSDDNAIAETFLGPVAAAFCMDASDPPPTSTYSARDVSLVRLNAQAGTVPGQRIPGQICGYNFLEGDPTYSCKECAIDATCVLCQDCFKNSIHKNHKYRMYTSNGSGYCDCGDENAWKDGHACDHHAVRDSPGMNSVLAPDLAVRMKELTTVVLEYATDMVTWEKTRTFAKDYPAFKLLTYNSRAFQTIMYNDETHTYDAVIRALELAVHCTKEQAMYLATVVDREGRSSVYAGPKETCDRVANEIRNRTSRDVNTRTEKSGPLEVWVVESELAAHQSLAIIFITWLNSQTAIFPLLCDVIGEVLLAIKYEDVQNRFVIMQPLDQPEESEDEESDRRISLITRIMRSNRGMWKAARGAYHQLIMKTLLMNMEQKMEFSKRFIRCYEQIYGEFVEDDHEHEISVVALTVQVLTDPPIARTLMCEEAAMKKVFEVLLKHCRQYVGPTPLTTAVDVTINPARRKRFDFTGRRYPAKLKRALHMMRDEVYMLTSVPTPEEWTDTLRKNFVMGFGSMLKFVALMQGMDEVRRQYGDHQVWEQEWETAFNIQLRSQEAYTLAVAWAASDRKVHRKVLSMVLDAVVKVIEEENNEEGGAAVTHARVEVAGHRRIVRAFDVLRQPVSVHLPLFRIFTALLTVPSELNRFLIRDEQVDEEDEALRQKIYDLQSDLYELPLRVLVLCAQAGAQLWRRNGFSLVNQIHNYFSPLCRGEMFDRDIVMLQLGAALVEDPNDFIVQIMTRYRVSTWAEPNFCGVPRGSAGRFDQEEMSKITVNLAEEMLTLLIYLASERYRPGVGKCSKVEMFEREVIHALAIGPQTFSSLQNKIVADPELSISINAAAEKVGTFKRNTPTAPGHFILKEEYWNRYDAFFYHYSRSNASQAEQYQRKVRAGKDRSIVACAPPIPIPFEPLFAPVTRFLRCSVLLQTLELVLKRTAKRNRFSSENLLHRALHLIGLGLLEQSIAPLQFDFLKEAAKAGLLDAMEKLRGTPESQPHSELLWWTIQKYKEVEKLVTLAKAREEGGEADETVVLMDETKHDENIMMNQESESEKKRAKQAKAAQMRAKAMSMMSKLQKKFTDQFQEEMDESVGGVERNKDGEKIQKPTVIRYEDEDTPVLTPELSDLFPVCLGFKKMDITEVQNRMVRCVLCQEEEELSNEGSKFVVAALLQNHNDTNVLRERHRPRQAQQTNRLLDPEQGEYHCPLCKRVSNTALPLLPPMQSYPVPGFSMNKPAIEGETFESWTDQIRRFVALTKPKHSRKRSHSERSLLDLVKERDKRSKKDGAAINKRLDFSIHESGDAQIAPGSLEGALSNSVPSASQMNLLMDQALELEQNQREESPAADEEEEDPYPPGTILEVVRLELEVDDRELLDLMRMAENRFPPQPEGQEEEAVVVDLPAEAVVRRPAPPIAQREIVPPWRRGGDEAREDELFPGMNFPSFPFGILKAIRKLNKKIIPPSLTNQEESVRNFTKFLIKVTTGLEAEDRGVGCFNYVVCVWRTTVQVVRSLAALLEVENKPLFGALNTRQRDCLLCLSRLSAVLAYNMQSFPEHIKVMLRIFLHPTVAKTCAPSQPKTKAPVAKVPADAKPAGPYIRRAHTVRDRMSMQSPPQAPIEPRSPPPVYNCNVVDQAAAGPSKKKANTITSSALSLIFGNEEEKKEATFHLLHVDVLSLTMELMMCIGWTWSDGERICKVKPQNMREFVPDGSMDEMYVLRLGLVAFHFQVMATYVENEDEEMMDISEREGVEGEERSREETGDAGLVERIQLLWWILRPRGSPLKRPLALIKVLHSATLTFLRPLALLYQSLRLVPPPEALRDPSVDTFVPLCRFMGIPSSLKELLMSTVVDDLFTMWAPCVPEDVSTVPQQPFRINQLMDLPYDFSELITKAARFRCPTIPTEDKSSSMPTMCLICGQILCSQSYCCQKTIGKDNIGACMQHLSKCTGANGLFLRIRDCRVVLLTTRLRGSIRPAPYVDEFGEYDQGFRRGNPLHLNNEMYAKLRHLWLHQGISEEVVNQYDMDNRTIMYDWNHF